MFEFGMMLLVAVLLGIVAVEYGGRVATTSCSYENLKISNSHSNSDSHVIKYLAHQVQDIKAVVRNVEDDTRLIRKMVKQTYIDVR